MRLRQNEVRSRSGELLGWIQWNQPGENEARAQAMYHARAAERGPRWDQLSDVTKSVWRELAVVEILT